MMSDQISQFTSELEKITADARENFGALSAEQINWKPAAESWSVGQCFEHLIRSNELFFGELDKIAAGTRRNSFLENYSPLSSFFGKLLASSLKKDARKFKAPTPKIVPPSEVDANIVELFEAHQAELIGKIKAAGKADLQKTKVTSPFMSLITYRLADGYQIIVEHEQRHLRQAGRVLAMQSSK